jgi:hypothetical protein
MPRRRSCKCRRRNSGDPARKARSWPRKTRAGAIWPIYRGRSIARRSIAPCRKPRRTRNWLTFMPASGRSRRPMPSSGDARSAQSVNACRPCGRAFGRGRSLGWRAALARPSCCRPSIRSNSWTAAPMTDSRRPSPAGCRPPSDHMLASSKRWRHRRRARSAARRLHGWRGATAHWAAMRCAPPCSAPMTGSAPI